MEEEVKRLKKLQERLNNDKIELQLTASSNEKLCNDMKAEKDTIRNQHISELAKL